MLNLNYKVDHFKIFYFNLLLGALLSRSLKSKIIILNEHT